LAQTIEYDESAVKDLKKLDRQVQREILDFMEKCIGQAEDPRSFGKPLRHSKFGLWRYRLRDYCIICQLQRAKLTVLVVAIGHRSIIYDANQGPSAATDLCCLLRPRQGALCLFPFRTRGDTREVSLSLKLPIITSQSSPAKPIRCNPL
jgi:mRNA interferase RelE/StbE